VVWQMNRKVAPICLFAYKRPVHLRKTIDALLKNRLAARSHVVVYADGAKSAADLESVQAVRSVCRATSGFASIRVVERTDNVGLSRSVIAGVTEMCNDFERTIVLEDDLVVSPYFLDFMNAGLDTYDHDQSVFSIHGYLFPVRTTLPETFFLLGADCWGWATWSRAWRHFEPDGRKLLEKLDRGNLLERFDFNGAYDYAGMLRQQIDGQVDSWAIRWQASALLMGGLTLYPGRSLVRNIGFDDTGTHSSGTRAFDVKISGTPIRVERIPLVENEAALRAFAEYYRRLRPSLIRRAVSRLKRALRLPT
jgi:hypothetical protein